MPHPFDRYGTFTDLAALVEASDRPLRKSLRVNTLKSSVEDFKKWAVEKGWQLTSVPWCREGFFVDREDHSIALGKDLLHLLGHTYMQEAASMLPVAVLDPQPGEIILDMSAAPGSKTTQIAARMSRSFPPSPPAPLPEGEGSPRGLVIANDVQEKRLWTLKSSLHRCGVTNVIVTKKVGQWFAKNMTERFDRVLIDAPCTAQGTSRKDSDALLYSSLENVGKMAKLQRELLASAIHACKTGGRIVYSTCTLTPEENEEVIASMLQKFPGQVEVVDPREIVRWSDGPMVRAIEDSHRVQAGPSDHPTIRPFPALRLWPHVFDTEGFFCAALRKLAPTKHPEKLPPVRFQEEPLPPARQKDIAKICEEMYGSSFQYDGDRLFLRSDQLILTTEAVEEFRLPVQNYALGIPFAKKLEDGRIRLSHEIITLRGKEAEKNVLEISEQELDALLDGKDIACPPEMRGDPILLYKGIPVGSSLAQRGVLKNRLPRWIVAKS